MQLAYKRENNRCPEAELLGERPNEEAHKQEDGVVQQHLVPVEVVDEPLHCVALVVVRGQVAADFRLVSQFVEARLFIPEEDIYLNSERKREALPWPGRVKNLNIP